MIQPDRAQLRQFLQRHYNDDELETLCFDYFPEVKAQFTIGMTKPQKVRLLIEDCERRGMLSNLVAAVTHGEKAAVYRQFLAEVQHTNFNLLAQPPTQNFVHEKTGLEMMYISAGAFLYGEKKEKRTLPAFWMSKTPVTNAVYKRFIIANPEYHVPKAHREYERPYAWDEKKRTFPPGKAYHPVVLVAQIDVEIFAQWAGLMLPMEEQWEKAARGTDGRPYSWGTWQEDCANTAEAGVKDMTPVGYYSPAGDSPYGCVDMIGNVWERTATKHEYDGYILRGGSWNETAPKALVTTRYGYFVPPSADTIGFRVCLMNI